MKKIYKVLFLCIALMAVIVMGVVGYMYFLLDREVPPDNARVELAGLSAEVEVVIDRWGVPHIFGSSDKDLARVLGYFHARDRLWQLDLLRRAAGGCLSEILGEALYDYDVLYRVIGLRRTAEKIVKTLDKDTLEIIDAYCDGVNAYIKSAPRYPTVEFRILGYEMEPWTPVDVLTLARNTGWNLAANWNVEMLRFAVAARVGDERMWEIIPRHGDPGPYIIPEVRRDYKKIDGRIDDGGSVPGEQGSLPAGMDTGRITALLKLDRKSRQTAASIAGAPMASNSWVLSPSKTASGGAILCNDPHLELLLPSVWYESHLRGDDIDVTGVAFPGTPFIVLGHTPDVAWGATTTMSDTQDLYKLVTDPGRPGKYYYDGRWVPFEKVVEIVRVKIKGEIRERRLEVRSTVHGPVITDAVDFGKNTSPMALRWTGYEASDEVGALFGMARAKDWTSFREALRGLKVPMQKWVYADRKGHIGYVAGGLLPIRKKGDGSSPAPGDDPEYGWAGFVPYEDNPSVYDPPAGYVATANNKIVPDSYPYIVSTGYAAPYRAMRIVEVLESGDNFNADDMARLQMDTKTKLGERIAPYFIRAYDVGGPADNEKLAELVEKLRAWDFSTSAESMVPTFFFESYRRAFSLTYRDEVSGDLWGAIREEVSVYNGFDNGIENNFGLFDDRNTPDRVEGRDDILVEAMTDAIEFLEDELGSNIDKWKWGKLHTIIFDHPFGGQHPWLRKTLSVGPYPLAGSRGTVNNGFFRWWTSAYKVRSGPSMRHIVDFGNTESNRFTITVGQSGHRLSDHYSDQVHDWIAGEYHPSLTSRSAIENVAEGVMEFVPLK